MTVDAFRRIALSMPEAVERAHMGHPDFRVGKDGRIFATLFGQERMRGMVKLTPTQQRRLITEHPDAFASVKGGWGRQGATQVMLHHVDVGTLRSAMRLAWRNAAPARLADRAIFADAKEGLPTTITSPAYFTTPEAFRAWLHKHHRTHDELVVGFWKVGTGKPSITWQQSVAEALCYGWIDGIRRSLSAATYTIRFTPRRRNSAWSAINIRLMAELESAGRMTAAGRAAFDARPHKTGAKAAGYKAQKKDATLDAGRLRTFRHHGSGKAWTFFQSQPPGYRKAAMWWVMQAKQKATRDRRLARLLEVSAKGKRLS